MPALPGVPRSEKRDELWREGLAGGSCLPRMSRRQGRNRLLRPPDVAHPQLGYLVLLRYGMKSPPLSEDTGSNSGGGWYGFHNKRDLDGEMLLYDPVLRPLMCLGNLG